MIVDIGTGDGLYVYQSAQRNPSRFYIGIDPSPRPLEKISEKIHRKPAKGGLPNVLFVQAAVEDLPDELDGTADEVHVHFPWGSLLRALASGERATLANLRRLCAPGALLEVVIGIDPDRDRTEIERLGLRSLSPRWIEAVLIPRYREAGLDVIEHGTLDASEWGKLQTSWAKRLKGRETRTVHYLIARAV
ncbi:MAG TPA: class I SAM-dependent methyltransferase [Thermoanaerobaculia bacterium]|nr:class I SAM-dependent methyltransferase [Thermoanaerobaculia bacterium]